MARLLTTLEGHGLARRTGAGWGLGLALLALAANVELVLRDAARPTLEALAERFGETALLTVREGDEAVAINQVLGAGSQIVQVRYRTGYRHPLDMAAHGRALLASPATDGAEPPTTVSEGELEPGVRGVAAPIFRNEAHREHRAGGARPPVPPAARGVRRRAGRRGRGQSQAPAASPIGG